MTSKGRCTHWMALGPFVIIENSFLDSNAPYRSRMQHHSSSCELKMCRQTLRNPSTPPEGLALVRPTRPDALERDRL